MNMKTVVVFRRYAALSVWALWLAALPAQAGPLVAAESPRAAGSVAGFATAPNRTATGAGPKTVLILTLAIVDTPGGGVAVTTHEFDSQKACGTAGAAWLAEPVAVPHLNSLPADLKDRVKSKARLIAKNALCVDRHQ